MLLKLTKPLLAARRKTVLTPGNRYSKGVIFIQITLNHGRSVETKNVFYRRVADDIHKQEN